MQSMIYPQYRFSYPSPTISQSQPVNRYARFDSHPIALTQSPGDGTQHNTQEILPPATTLPSIAPESGAGKRFSFFD